MHNPEQIAVASESLLAPSEELWKAVGSASPIPKHCSAITTKQARLYSDFKTAATTIVAAANLNKKSLSDLEAWGIDADKYKTFIEDFLQPDEHWSRYLRKADYTSEWARNTVWAREAYCGYQDRAVRSKNLYVLDPFTGEQIAPADSFLTFGRSCYFFAAKRSFFLFCAGAGAKALCIYVPSLDLILDLRAGLSKFLGQELFSNLLHMLTMRFAKNLRAYNESLEDSSDPLQERYVAVALQQAENPAHHVWNFYPSLERLCLSGAQGSVSRVIFGGSQFYGDINDLFPEFKGIIEHGQRASVIDPYPFSKRHLVLSMGGYFIPRTLISRIRRTAALGIKETGQPGPDGLLGAAKNRPVVWMGMRVGDKSWVSQAEGLTKVANIILEKYPHAVILLDGFSYPAGRDEVSHKWERSIGELRAIGEAICSKLSSPTSAINMVGNSLYESIAWAEKVDVYFSPVGSTQHKIGWFTDAEGLVYSPPRGDREFRRESLPGSWEAEGAALPRYLIGEPVNPGQRRGDNDRRAHLENVNLDSDYIARELLSLIDNKITNKEQYQE